MDGAHYISVSVLHKAGQCFIVLCFALSHLHFAEGLNHWPRDCDFGDQLSWHACRCLEDIMWSLYLDFPLCSVEVMRLNPQVSIG